MSTQVDSAFTSARGPRHWLASHLVLDENRWIGSLEVETMFSSLVEMIRSEHALQYCFVSAAWQGSEFNRQSDSASSLNSDYGAGCLDRRPEDLRLYHQAHLFSLWNRELLIDENSSGADIVQGR